MMAILSIALGMIAAIGRLILTNIQVQEARVAFNRMYEFAGLETERQEGQTSQKEKWSVNTLIIKNLSFRFAGKKALLENISLNLKKGKLTVIMGEVGSGKSVLLRLLQKFRDYEGGQILINGENELKNTESADWRTAIGVVPQEVKIFSGTLLDNITLGNFMEEAEKAVEFCKVLGFDQFFESLPQDYLTILGEEGVNLSGGQRQLVGLARALYNNPEVLILDEPTAAMDRKTEGFVIELLRTLKADKIILMVSHRRNFDGLADDIFVMENGCIKKAEASIIPA